MPYAEGMVYADAGRKKTDVIKRRGEDQMDYPDALSYMVFQAIKHLNSAGEEQVRAVVREMSAYHADILLHYLNEIQREISENSVPPEQGLFANMRSARMAAWQQKVEPDFDLDMFNAQVKAGYDLATGKG